MSAPHGWWRRNRLALFTLPLLLIAAMAANSSRLVQYWWPDQLRYATDVEPDGSTTLTATVRDANGESGIRMKLAVLETVTTTEAADFVGDEPKPIDVPPELRVWRVTVRVEADPDEVLTGCQVQVLDDADREYQTGVSIVADHGPRNSSYTCVPADDPGPMTAFTKGPQELDTGLDGDADPRPPAYDIYVYAVMPQDREPDRVRFWFEPPTYAELPLKLLR